MDINIGTVLTVLVILFSVNVVCIATGLYPLASAGNGGIISGSTYADINSNYSANAGTLYSSTSVATETTAASSTDFITAGINFIGDVFSGANTFIALLGGVFFGYRYIFISLQLPVLLVWLFTGIVMIVQAACLLYLASYVSSILRGGSII
jgi:hypothetical protein